MSLTSSFFTDNRRRFADKLPDNTVVYLFAGEAKRMCGDTDYRFLPDRNFYYMTGLSRAGLIFVIEKKAGVTKDILYAPAHDKIAERWGGKRPDFEKLTAISGIEDISDVLRPQHPGATMSITDSGTLRPALLTPKPSAPGELYASVAGELYTRLLPDRSSAGMLSFPRSITSLAV